jgi:uncharacterized protein YbbC (DUF1343 family)
LEKVPLFFLRLLLFFAAFPCFSEARVLSGLDVFINSESLNKLKGKKVAIAANHTAIDSQNRHILSLLIPLQEKVGFTITAVLTPEHGLYGSLYAAESSKGGSKQQGISAYPLYGKEEKAGEEAIEKADVVLYDMQDVGVRPYTYTGTLFRLLDLCASKKKEVIVLDRPNPMGAIVDGPLLHGQKKTLISSLNVPYCHGMTPAELARLYVAEEKLQVQLTTIPMRGWKRSMSFAATGLTWVPTSPQIPEADTPLYYATTGLIGELSLVSIGVGYTLPFKVVGAPWIDEEAFCEALNKQKFPGVQFLPFRFRPFFGKFKEQDCKGALIVIKDPSLYRPVATQFLLLGILKSLYPNPFVEAMQKRSAFQKEAFIRTAGASEVWEILEQVRYPLWRLIDFDEKERQLFLKKRKKFLFSSYK